MGRGLVVGYELSVFPDDALFSHGPMLTALGITAVQPPPLPSGLWPDW
jgi:hypothetical protein